MDGLVINLGLSFNGQQTSKISKKKDDPKFWHLVTVKD